MKLSLSILFLTISVLCLTSCISKPKADDTIKSEEIVPASINEVLELDTYLTQLKEETRPHHFVDVRTPAEVAEGTIEGAINIDYKADNFIEEFKKLDKDQPVYLFCRSGNRSGKATKLLIKEGYNEIYDLKGGYLVYSESQK